MKNITVSIDDETHHQARIRAAELGTSVSALVRGYLRSLVTQPADVIEVSALDLETEDDRRRRLLNEVVEEIVANGGGLHMSENLSREELYSERFTGRDALR